MQNPYIAAFYSLLVKAKSKVTDFVFDDGPRVLIAILILVVGIIIARRLHRLARRTLDNKDIEPPVKMLISRVVRLVVVIFALIIALGAAGINVMALVAGISVAGLGIGLAMQDMLANLVAGLVIIFTKPFRIGEFVELTGVGGEVKAIRLFSTTLLCPDLSRAVVPNRKIVCEILRNHGEIRQLNLQVGIAYDSNVQEALTLVQDILAANERILQTPAPAIAVSALADGSIQIAIRPWSNLADFGSAQTEIYRAIIERFRAIGIAIPPPQREVRLVD